MDESSSPLHNVTEVMAAAAVPLVQAGPRAPRRDTGWPDYVRRTAAGDYSALSLLYDESNGLVYGLALRMLGDVADAEETTLDVYTQVWRRAASFDSGRGSVSAWLTTLTRSRAIDRMRSRSSQRRVEEPLSDELAATTVSETGGWMEFFETERKLIKQCLDTLSPEHRELIELAFFSGFTHSELAERMGLPLGTVKTRIRTAVIRLREMLGPLLEPQGRRVT